MSIDVLLGGGTLDREESRRFFKDVVTGTVEPVHLAAALIALKFRGETPPEVAGAAEALLEAATPLPDAGFPVYDCCGTGGDGGQTLNISTAVAFVGAAAGVKVAKHGNRALSSRSGSTDVLSAVGIDVESSPARSHENLKRFGVCFLSAPAYHPGIAHAMGVRRALGTRTMFNLLGPLVNPARPTGQLLGIYDPERAELLASTLLEMGTKRAMVVHGSGIDEVALHGPTRVVELRDGELSDYEVTPEALGVVGAPLSDLAGGGPEHNAQRLEALLSGSEAGPYRDSVAVNAGALIYLADRAPTHAEGVETALQVLSDGRAGQVLEEMRGSSG